MTTANHRAERPPSLRSDGESRATDAERLPAVWVRLILSGFACLQVIVLLIASLAVVEPSATHAWLLQRLNPYLRATRFGVDDRPVYLSYGGESEQALRLQVSEADPDDSAAWRTIDPPGIAGMAANDRYRRWLSSIVLLAEQEQPALVAEFLLPLAADDPSIRSMRIIRLPNDLSLSVGDATLPPYTARVVRRGENVSLLHVPSPSKSAIAVPDLGDPE